ncbi:hypothetical protein PRIPAC_87241 [Pristionchus pacificus]|uniref:Uncharacterized protein n=1 Tax=Pristionchus pacificus TaxID=54126 RepID=A0A2A6CV29_PRIPA|nr:hypothetical protein PRIPAC_87241 [Pristionchus pacificus]|eukprot:PDM82019.1 hypothetical protein PRIPAC_36412 [Pristionchus pacificus]
MDSSGVQFTMRVFVLLFVLGFLCISAVPPSQAFDTFSFDRFSSFRKRAVAKNGLVKTTKKPLAKLLPAPLPERTPDYTQRDEGDVFDN